MRYTVKEVFYSIQGEGVNAGMPAVFCRFSGCNLWNGVEAYRDISVCQFCDTDFVGGDKFSAKELAAAMHSFWDCALWSDVEPFVVLTGGEPLLQVDQPLLDELRGVGAKIAIETNGTVTPRYSPRSVDWVCVSPKTPPHEVVVRSGDELKLVWPQLDICPDDFVGMDFDNFVLQPMDSGSACENAENTTEVIDYCMDNPGWRVGIQAHKLLGLR